MASPLSSRDRHNLDVAAPFVVRLSDGATRSAAALFFPFFAVIQGAYVIPGAAVNVTIAGGFCRDGQGNIVEMPPSANFSDSATLAVPASVGQSQAFVLSFDPAAKVYHFTAGVAATTGTQLTPAVPAAQAGIAVVTLAHGDTGPSQAEIDNVSVRSMR